MTPVSDSAAQTTPANPASANLATCSVTDPGDYTYDRLDYCLTGFQITYTEYSEVVRCDALFPYATQTSTGCVIPAVRPQITLSLTTYGAAAALYGFAEQYWIDAWGTNGSPLQRQPNPTIQAANRLNTCGAGATRPFVIDDDIVPTDSCDEYPFAATYQGGKNGGLCADVFPLLENGTWDLYADPNAPAYTLDEPCLRGHVPSAENSLVGPALGDFAKSQRVIDGDQYNVVVTP